MTIVKTGAYLTAGLLTAALSAGPAGAVQIDFDLDNGTVFGDGSALDPFNWSSNGIGFSPMQVPSGESLEIWINFVDLETGAKQHLEIFDQGDPLDETFGVSVSGPSIINGIPIFDVELTGVKGDFLPPSTMFSSNVGDCFDVTSASICVSTTFQVDLTDTSFLLHDIHVIITPPTGSSPSDSSIIDTVQFGFALDRPDSFEIGVWPMPEPGVLALFGFGLLGLAAMSWRDRARGLARSE